MTITISAPVTHDLKPKITVFGVGGAGGNAVNNMITSHLEGVEFVVANTDAQSLSMSLTERRVQLGTALTQGLGAGARPDIGRMAAEESLEAILDNFQGTNMVFITAGMGGGTGTGGAPVIARAAREQGILTVGVVTKPFHFEGAQRMRIAEAGIAELQQCVDTLIIIPNQNLFRIADDKTTFTEAFEMADKVLYSGVRGVTDLMVMPGLINLDFADVQAVMMEMGKAMMGTGEAEGEKRALDAADLAINNPLLDDVSLRGARGVLVNITGGKDMTLFEVDEACNHIREQVDHDANIIFGSTFDEQMSGTVRVSVVATGIDMEEGSEAAVAAAKATRPGMPVQTVQTPRPDTVSAEPEVPDEAGAEAATAAAAADESSQLDLISEAMDRYANTAGHARESAAQAGEAPFIPPQPVEPAPEPVYQAAAPAAPDATSALAEADFLNATPPPTRPVHRPIQHPAGQVSAHATAQPDAQGAGQRAPQNSAGQRAPQDRADQPQRPGLFARVTSSIGLRGEAPAPASRDGAPLSQGQPAASRREPALEGAGASSGAGYPPAESPAVAAARDTADVEDLAIPAFLRRQRN